MTRRALVLLDPDRIPVGVTVLGWYGVLPGQPYAYIKDMRAFVRWAREHAPDRVSDEGHLDYEWVRRVRKSFESGPSWVADSGQTVPVEGMAWQVEPPRIRVVTVGGEHWASRVVEEEAVA